MLVAGAHQLSLIGVGNRRVGGRRRHRQTFRFFNPLLFWYSLKLTVLQRTWWMALFSLFFFLLQGSPRYDDYVISGSAGLIRLPWRGHTGFPLLKRSGRFLGFSKILQTVLDEIHGCTSQRGASPLNKHLWGQLDESCWFCSFFPFWNKTGSFISIEYELNWVYFTNLIAGLWRG